MLVQHLIAQNLLVNVKKLAILKFIAFHNNLELNDVIAENLFLRLVFSKVFLVVSFEPEFVGIAIATQPDQRISMMRKGNNHALPTF